VWLAVGSGGDDRAAGTPSGSVFQNADETSCCGMHRND
jgi:hypothetical protein